MNREMCLICFVKRYEGGVNYSEKWEQGGDYVSMSPLGDTVVILNTCEPTCIKYPIVSIVHCKLFSE